MESNEEIQANLRTGYIKLYRSVNDHYLLKDDGPYSRKEAWIDILMQVNHKPKKTVLKGKVFHVNRGESICSLDTWAKRWKWNKSKVRRFLEQLKNEHMIDTINEHSTTRLIVCEYDTYNNNGNDIETKPTRIRNNSESSLTPNKNGNNDNKKKRIPASAGSVFQKCMEIYHDFVFKQTSFKPNIDAVTGKSLKTILNTIRKNVPAGTEDFEKEIITGFKYIFDHFDKWDPFHKEQLKLNQINSNLINIIATIKKSSPVMNGVSQPTMTEEERNMFMYGNPRGPNG